MTTFLYAKSVPKCSRAMPVSVIYVKNVSRESEKKQC